MDRQNSSTMLWFLGGLTLGTLSIVMMAPEVNDRARRGLAQGGGLKFGASGLDLLQRGRELFERGCEIAEDAAELFERYNKLPEDKTGAASL